MDKLKRMLTHIWWVPSWWMTRLVTWIDPKSAWTRTVSLHIMVTCATPTFKVLNAVMWFLLFIEIALLCRLYHLWF